MATEQTRFFAQFTPDQLRAGFARNAASLKTMADKATRTGRKVNGFTADYLHGKAAEYLALSTASDDAIRVHVNRPVPPHADRKAMTEATLTVGRNAS